MNRLHAPLLAALLSLAAASPALAHSELASAAPAVNSTVPQAPSEVSITFTEEIEPRFSSIHVLDPNGHRVDQGAAHAAANDAKLLVVSLKQLSPGTYKVQWQATSVDSHKTKGSFQFTYKP